MSTNEIPVGESKGNKSLGSKVLFAIADERNVVKALGLRSVITSRRLRVVRGTNLPFFNSGGMFAADRTLYSQYFENLWRKYVNLESAIIGTTFIELRISSLSFSEVYIRAT